MEKLNQKRKVLVIGSIPEFHQLMEESLRDRFEVIYASNESEGLSKARGERPETRHSWDILTPGEVPSGSTKS